MSTTDYTHLSRNGKLLISITDLPGDMCQCSPIRLKFVHVSSADDTVREYVATYTYGQMYDICPVFAAVDELYGILSINPKVRVYDSRVTVRWIYRGINVAYRIKLNLALTEPVIQNPPHSHSDMEMRTALAEAECVRLKDELEMTDIQLRCVLEMLDKMNARLVALECTGANAE